MANFFASNLFCLESAKSLGVGFNGSGLTCYFGGIMYFGKVFIVRNFLENIAKREEVFKAGTIKTKQSSRPIKEPFHRVMRDARTPC